MNPIVRNTALLCCVLLNTQLVQAQANKQQTLSLSVGSETIFPEADFRRTHKLGFGGSIKGEYTFGKHGSITVSTGYCALTGRLYFEGTNAAPLDYQTIVAIHVKASPR